MLFTTRDKTASISNSKLMVYDNHFESIFVCIRLML